MSVRELRVCDVIVTNAENHDGTPKPAYTCANVYAGTCPMCEMECCDSHFGKDQIYVQAGIHSAILGSVQVGVCDACSRHLRRTQEDQPLQSTVAAIPLIKILRPMIVAVALAEPK